MTRQYKKDWELELFKRRTRVPRDPKKVRLPRTIGRLNQGKIRGSSGHSLTAPARKSTRPVSAEGKTSFHFKLTSVGKRPKNATSKTNAPGASWQHILYIEREDAAETLSASRGALAQSLGVGGTPPIKVDAWGAPTNPESTQMSDVQEVTRGLIYVESGNIEHARGVPISFGNCGTRLVERLQFWSDLEDAERVNGRVQNRLVVELPYEISAVGRAAIVKRFSEENLESKGLGYWVVVHKPDPLRNDYRNYHAHIVFTDRPVKRLADGRWDFLVVTEQRRCRKKGGGIVDYRPHIQKKDRDMNGPECKTWIVTMRKSFADIANQVMADEGVAKRYDHRTYEEMGIIKEPTTHLGTRNAAMEAAGVATKIGVKNAHLEREFEVSNRINATSSQFEELNFEITELSRILGPQSPLVSNTKMAETYQRAVDAFRSATKSRIKAELDLEERTLRLHRREKFLNNEIADIKPNTTYQLTRLNILKNEEVGLTVATRQVRQLQEQDQACIDQAAKERDQALVILSRILAGMKRSAAAPQVAPSALRPVRPAQGVEIAPAVAPSSIPAASSDAKRISSRPPLGEHDAAPATDHVPTELDVPAAATATEGEYSRGLIRSAVDATQTEEEVSHNFRGNAQAESVPTFGPGSLLWELAERIRSEEEERAATEKQTANEPNPLHAVPYAVFTEIEPTDREGCRDFALEMLKYDFKSFKLMFRQTQHAVEIAPEEAKRGFAQSAGYMEAVARLLRINAKFMEPENYDLDALDDAAISLGFRSASDPALPQRTRDIAAAAAIEVVPTIRTSARSH